MLEDLGFYCIDNIPAALLKPFVSYTVRRPETTYERTAIGLDARNTAAEVASVRSEEHTSELQSRLHLVCRLLLEQNISTLLAHYIRRMLNSKTSTRLHS